MSFPMDNKQNTQMQQYQTQSLDPNVGSSSNELPQYETVQLGPPPYYEPIFVPMKLGLGSVPPTLSGSAPFDFNQLNQQYDMQPPISYEEHNLIQGFGSNQDLQQEIDPNNPSDSDDLDDLEMFINNPKIEKKMNKFFSKVSRLFPDKYRSMLEATTTSNDQTNVHTQHEFGNLLSFESHLDETNAH